MRRRLLWAGTATLLALMAASVMIGAARIDPFAAGHDARAALVLMESRVPRTLAVVLTGAALSIAGVVMQALVRNRFVGPDTVGTSESAALGLLAVTIFAPAAPVWVKMLGASAAALVGTSLFLAVIRRLPAREVMLVPIVGLVLSGVIGAAVTFVAWQMDLMQLVETWLFVGEFSGVVAGRYELLWVAAGAAALAWFAADRFAILALGEQVAAGLGLNAPAVMRLGLVVVAVVSALVVSTVGMIPFVGLIVPNITARIMGDNLRASLPVVAIGGAVLVLACDVVGRLVRYPHEIPAGSILGFIGAGVFLVLLWRAPSRA